MPWRRWGAASTTGFSSSPTAGGEVDLCRGVVSVLVAVPVPVDRVAVTSYGDDLALKRGMTIRGYVEQYGHEYDLALQWGSSAKQDWSLTKGGGVRSVSVGKGLTGHPVNLLIVDDPHKDRADAESEASRRAFTTGTRRPR